MAGNVGTALASLAGEVEGPAATVVCEASSFQLEDTLAFAPEVAVLLNLTEDHLDRHGTLEAPIATPSCKIFARQRAERGGAPGVARRSSLGIEDLGRLCAGGVC